MKRSEYESYVLSRCKDYVTEPYLVIAINEEAGEIAGWYKKFVLRENVTGKYSVDDLKGELGDLLFYITRLAQMRGWSLDDIMEHNKSKLDDRVSKGMKQIA
jgi:NTP pyrophosphatase (non-canonical NTP hydrolase)